MFLIYVLHPEKNVTREEVKNTKRFSSEGVVRYLAKSLMIDAGYCLLLSIRSIDFISLPEIEVGLLSEEVI